MKRFVRVLSAMGMLTALWLGMPSPSQADPLILTLPEGNFPISGFDPGPGNLLIQGAPPTVVGAHFETYFQANMSAVLGPNNLPIGGLGLNSTYELTVIARLSEVVQSVTTVGNTVIATFALAPVQVNPFFEIWFHNGILADNFNGTGFNTGTKILSGVVNSLSSSSFTIGDTTKTILIDNPNDAGGTAAGKAYWNGSNTFTLQGTGNNQLTLGTMQVDSVVLNPAFFKFGQTVTSYVLRPSTGLEFQNVDPSKFFSPNPNGVAAATVVSIAQGILNTVTPPNQVIEIDDKESLQATPAAPEPSTLVLSMSGLALFGVVRAIRRRRQTKA